MKNKELNMSIMMKYEKTLKLSGICFLGWLVAALLATLVASCSSDENSGGSGEKTASLSLMISGKGSVTRATGDNLPDNESTIHSLTVGLFFGDGSVNTIVEPSVVANSSGGITSESILCSPGSCDVIVVANVPNGTFDGVQTKNEFIGKTIGLIQTVRDGKQASDLLPMSGISEVPVVLEAGKSASAAVNLSRLVSRISISSIKTAFSGNNAYATFKLDRVFLCNALEASKIAPGDIALTRPDKSTWLHGGMVDEDHGNIWTDGVGFLLNDITPAGGIPMTATEYTVPHWFYAFANDDKTYQTKLVLSGYFDLDGDGTQHQPIYVYYPIVINQDQQGTTITGPSDNPNKPATGLGDGTIARNRDYRIKAIIKGDGESSPGSEVKPSSLELTVSVDDWTLVIMQEVELN